MKAVRWVIMIMMSAVSVAYGQGQNQVQNWGRTQQFDRVSVELGMNGMEYSGTHNIRLRQLLKDRNPWLQTRDFRLENVTIWAKSRAGKGVVRLVIDGQVIHQAGVPGDERSYFRHEASTYAAMQMHNHSYRQDPSWVLSTSGNIRILKMRFNLVEERGYPRPVTPQVVQVAKGKFNKIIEDRNSHDVRVNDVQEIRIVSLDRSLLVKEVVIGYANGATQRAYYNTEVKRGRDLRIPLQGRDVRFIDITGTSLDLIGSRAEYAVQAVVRRSR